MSIINNAHAGSQINLLCMIFRVIHRNDGKLSVDEITELCRPAQLPIGDTQEKRFPTNLKFWMKEAHQLWAEGTDGKLELVKKIASPTPDNIAEVVSKVLFAADVQDVFANSSNDGIEQLFLSLSCILASEKFTFDSREPIDSRTLDRLFAECLPGVGIPNNSEKPVINEYGNFLGYLEPTKGGFYVDPTRAVSQALPVVFSDDRELGAAEYLKRLAACCPLLDGGEFRQQVEKRMSKYVSSDSQSVSKPLSLAIKRLNLAGILAVDASSDDPDAYRLQLPGSEQLFSNIEYRVEGGQS